MVFIAREEAFRCEHCGKDILPLGSGTYRNHCPACLRSKHVDREGPGDRASPCGGIMDPVGVDFRGKKGWMLRQRCRSCGKEMLNKAAHDDNLATFSAEEPPR